MIHLNRLANAHHQHDVLLWSSLSLSLTLMSEDNNNDASIRNQLLLPTFVSPDISHDVTATYLSDLTARNTACT